MLAYICRICHNSQNCQPLTLREMMFGSRDTFPYFLCPACGAIQIAKVPSDLSKYYPPDYYSFGEIKADRALKKLIKCYFIRPILAGQLAFLAPTGLRKNEFFSWLRKAKLRGDDKILDIGSGSGVLLNKMANYGYQALFGVDPYLEKDLVYPNGVTVWKKNLSELEPAYDFIMAHHTFEHIADPKNFLAQIERLLKPNGLALIRTPVANCYAWEKYQTNWVQLDPPRHLFIHTPKSIRILAERVGLQLTDTVYDSSEFQFWASQQYQKDIPLFAPDSFTQGLEKSFFTAKRIQEFKSRSKELNAEKRGDQAAFWLRKT